jgi:hypothetical protein
VGKGKTRKRLITYSSIIRWRKKFVEIVLRKRVRSVVKRNISNPAETPGLFLKPNKLNYFMYSNVKIPHLSSHEIFDVDPYGAYPSYFNDLQVANAFINEVNPNTAGSGHMYNLAPVTLASSPSNPQDSELREKALIKLYQKCIDVVPNYGEAYGEAFETYETIHKILFEGVALITELVTMNKKRLLGRLKDVSPKTISEMWLTWVYGIKPLLSDIQDTLALIENSSRTWRSYSASVGVDLSSPYSGSTLSSNFTGREHIRKFHRFGVIIEGRLDFAEFRRRKLHWESTAANVYELIPFSFMLDWIRDLSTSLHAAHFFDDLQYAAWESWGNIISREVTVTGRTGTFRLVASGETRQVIQSVAVDRAVLSEIPDFPPPHVVSGQELLGVASVDKAINVLAILISGSTKN